MSPKQRKRPVIFGEVLFDRFPDGSKVLGGAPFNVAWNLHAFGQAPVLISRIGDDALGTQISEKMASLSMDTTFLQIDASHPTGTVNVSFQGGEPSYDIVAECAYDFIEPVDVSGLDDAAILYHGSLAMRGATTSRTLKEIVARLAVPRFIDVNLRTPWWHKPEVLDLLRGAAWVKLNEHELALLDPTDKPSSDAGSDLRRRYEWQGLILTRGSAGAELMGAGPKISVKPERASQVIDTVGAGDAFASVILLGLLQKWSLQSTLERAQSFASAVVGLRGATVTDLSFYAQFAEAWELNG